MRLTESHYIDKTASATRISQKSIILLLCSFAAMSSLGFGAEQAHATDLVMGFKNFLANRPAISHIAFTTTAPGVPQRRFIAAYSADGYFIRELKGKDNYLTPIGPSNKMHSALFAGKCGDLSWQISGFGVAKSISPDRAKPDPVAAFSQNEQAIVESVVGLGSQHVTPGTYRWNGNEFEATPSTFLRQMRPDLEVVKGKVLIRDSYVVELQNFESGTWVYEYSGSPNRPAWFPWKIKHVGGPNYKIDRVLEVETVRFGSDEEIKAALVPEAHILPEVALTKMYSNSVMLTQVRPDDPHAVQVVKLEIGDLAKGSSSRNAKIKVVRITIISSLGILFLLAMKALISRRSASKPRS